MKTKFVLSALSLLSISACSSVADQRATLLPTIDGRDRYSVSGLVMVSEVKEGVTKPYIEKGMALACPNGLEYENFKEAMNKKTPIGAWMQWQSVVICR